MKFFSFVFDNISSYAYFKFKLINSDFNWYFTSFQYQQVDYKIHKNFIIDFFLRFHSWARRNS